MSVDGSEDEARPMTERATPDQMYARIEALKAHEARNRVTVSPHGFEPLRCLTLEDGTQLVFDRAELVAAIGWDVKARRAA